MIQSDFFYNELVERGVGMFAGVPDSLLKDFCAYVDDNGAPGQHIITANEGNAIAVAAGYHMATKKIAAIYMQNSGLGNTVNPLTSLADPEVYRIPMLMIVGWRGEPGVKDEPQHVKQGRITAGQLELLEIPYWILEGTSDVGVVLTKVFDKIRETNAPVALLVRKDTFAPYKGKKKAVVAGAMTREESLREMFKLMSPSDLVVSTTGKTSREVFELRVERGEKQKDFLTVGGMGHAASIAAGVALGRPDRRVVCFDGDGSVLMHMGALPIIGDIKPKNLVHVLLNNSSHESVGGQPTVAGKMNFEAIALACGYAKYYKASSADDLKSVWGRLSSEQGPIFLEVIVGIGSRDNLARPTSTPEENKKSFMESIDGRS